MNTDDFKDMSIIENSLYKYKFKITEYVWLQMTSDDPTSLRARTSHSVLQSWTTHQLTKKKRGRTVENVPPVCVAQFPSCYSSQLSIKAATKKDLMDQCNYIPKECRNFYENLSSDQT